jgi:hypothetical protein
MNPSLRLVVAILSIGSPLGWVTPIEFQSEALAELLGKPTPPAPPAPMSATPEPFAPASLAQAIPDGEHFEAGVASLLQPGHPSSYRASSPTTDSGLVKRDRSRSQAPPSEGRPVAPSVRSPEEIRQMLARYRDGRNRPTTEDVASAASLDSIVPTDPFHPGGQA